MKRLVLVLAVAIGLTVAATPAYAATGTSLKTAKTISVSVDVASTALHMHTFSSSTQAYYFKMAVKKGVTYWADVFGTNSASKNHWLKVTLYRYNKTTKHWSQVGKETTTRGGGTSGWFSVKATATTYYALRIRPYNSHGKGASWGVRVIGGPDPIGPDTYPGDGTLSGAVALTPRSYSPTSWQNNFVYRYGIYGTCQLHSIATTTDADWFSAQLSSSVNTYTVEIFVGDWASEDVNCDLYYPNGTVAFAPGVVDGDWISFTFWDWPSGTYYFKVYGNGANRFWYRIGLFHRS
jgi:hypothetical protein